ncbi:MAG: SpoIIE family protein phosphatase [Candidatus Aminicenantes bacterium]|nr:SpoIIE family protein phosphatase [Candidatus Aminicenantes bacterium]
MGLIRDRILYFSVSDISDVGDQRRKTAAFAKELGFLPGDSEEISILVTEMMNNMLNHGGPDSRLIICRVEDNKKNQGIELWAIDNGSGINDFDQAFRDGHSSQDSLGLGLGTVKRFSDEIETGIKAIPEEFKDRNGLRSMGGLVICSRKWLPKHSWTGRNKNITIGAASRPKPGEKINGDSYFIRHLSSQATLAAVVDGLGHGIDAHEASRLAVRSLDAKADLPLPEIIAYTHKTLIGTRGATVGAALIQSDLNKVSFVGMGNIEARIVTPQKKHALISLGGIVGLKIRTPKVYEYIYDQDNFLVLYSDGINSGWQNGVEEWGKHPQKIAEYILKNYSRDHDDATILIIKFSPENS